MTARDTGRAEYQRTQARLLAERPQEARTSDGASEMTTDSTQTGTTAVRGAQRVMWAGGLYEVVATNGDLLTLDGVTVIDRNRYGRCRQRVTVLASDVVPVTNGGDE